MKARTCTHPLCASPLRASNKTGVCNRCQQAERGARFVQLREAEHESWYRPADDTPPAEVLRIATGVRV